MRRGFTLLELSIVLVIIAVVIGSGLVIFTNSLQASQYNATVTRMDEIEKALLNYTIANNRIPCPADLTLNTSSANYGLEAGAGSGSAIGVGTGVCTGTNMAPQANFVATSGTVEGGVPTRALKLPDDYIYDGWGHKFRYAADPTVTKSGALPFPKNGPCAPSTSGITVTDATGASRTTVAIYALISHGANGHGAYTSAGGIFSDGSVNANELTNCHCVSAGWASTYTPTYVETVPTQDPNNALDDFDDIVTFKEGWQMQAQNAPLASSPICVYVVDWNSHVQVFDPSVGTYLGQWGGWNNTANGSIWNPSQLAVDSFRNVWEADSYNNRVQKFDKNGNFLMAIGAGYNGVSGSVGSSGTGNGQFNYPEGIAIDLNANIWVLETNNQRVQEFSPSGIFIRAIGAGYNGVAGSPGSSGNAPGQFLAPYGVTVDNSGNIWVVDTQNLRLQEFTNTGTYMNAINFSYGNGNGEFLYPTSMAFDLSGNMWVADTYGARVQKLSSSGSWLATVGGGAACTGCASTTSCTCNTGSANGMFSGEISGLAVDSSGNAWVIDGWTCCDPTNERIQEFSPSGAWLKSIGGPPPHTCEASPSGSVPACASGSANGQFNYPAGIAVGSR